MAFSPLFAHPRRWKLRSISRATPRLRSSALPRNRSEALPLEFTHFLSDEVRLTPIIKGKMRFVSVMGVVSSLRLASGLVNAERPLPTIGVEFPT